MSRESIPNAVFTSVFVLFLSASFIGHAEDWPTFGHDPQRSGVSAESLTYPLEEAWVYQARHLPRPAWPAPAPRDYWHRLRDLKPVVTYDRTYHVVSEGGRAYFATSSDDRVCAVNTENGELLWSFYAEAPIRLAPTLWQGKVYFGSDDGWAYCLQATDGALLWKHRPSPDHRRLPGNGRVISLYPIRTSVLVDDGIAYYCAGIFPSQKVYTVALDAVTGEEIWVEETDQASPQGYMLANKERLFVPTGRSNPALFAREDAKYLGKLGGGGGAYAVLVDDALATGPGRRDGNTLGISDPKTKSSVATTEGIRMVVKGDMAYIHTKDAIKALDRTTFLALSREWSKKDSQRWRLEEKIKKIKRSDAAAEEKEKDIQPLQEELDGIRAEMAVLDGKKQACYKWSIGNEYPYAMILAGDALIAGGNTRVAAFNVENGGRVWERQVNGNAYGLSVANGKLYVSTDLGTIHCFIHAEEGNRFLVLEEDIVQPYPENAAYAERAKQLLTRLETPQGYALVLECGEGQLAYELAKQSELQVIALTADENAAQIARKRLTEAGLYGDRVTVQVWDKPYLPYTTYMMNLVTADSALANTLPEINIQDLYRVLRPVDGVACFAADKAQGDAVRAFAETTDGTLTVSDTGWLTLQRGAVPGAGEWTQLYCDVSHTAASTDSIEGPLTMQWFGEPGPQRIIDRHHRPMSPLFKDGQLYVNGNEVLYALDAYNGALRWTLETPGSRRVGSIKDCGHIVVADEELFIAVNDTVWAVDVDAGIRQSEITLPTPDDVRRDWGYLNYHNGLIFGTGQKQNASFTQMSDLTCSILEGDHRLVIMSDFLFAKDAKTGAVAWQYDNGVILNNGIAITGDQIMVLVSRNERAMNDSDGRIALRDFCKSDTYVVALNITTGEQLWEQPVTLGFEHIAFLNTAEGVALLSGTFNRGMEVYYAFTALNTNDGTLKWSDEFRALDIRGNEYSRIEGSHGEQWQHPVLVNGVIYERPYAFDLHTGEKLDFIAKRGGHGCGGFTGSPNYLFGRGDNPRMYPLAETETMGIQLTKVSRPGCWLNIIPAGGLVLLPESSSGCTCEYPIQTSFAFIPEALSAAAL